MAKKAAALEEFTQVVDKRQQSDSDDDNFRIPNSLAIKIKAKAQQVKSSILEALKLIPPTNQAAILKENLEILNQLMAPENHE